MKAKIIRKTFPKIRVLIREGKPLYQVDARRQGTNGRREHFSTKKEAEDRANAIAGDFDRLGNEGLNFPNDLRVMALHCSQKFAAIGKTIADATTHYLSFHEAEQEADGKPEGFSLVDLWKAHKESGSTKKLRKDNMMRIGNFIAY